MRMIIIDNKRVPARPPPNLDWETALNPVTPTSSARDQMKYFHTQEEQMEEAIEEVTEVQDKFMEFALGSTETDEAMDVEPPVNENGSRGFESPTMPLLFPEYAPPAETLKTDCIDEPTSTGEETEEELLAEVTEWLQMSIADKSDEEAKAFLRSILYGTSADTSQPQETKCDEATTEGDSSLTNAFAEPPPPKRSRRAKKREPVASTSNQAPGSTDLPFTFRRADRIGIHFACLEDINFDFVGDCFQCKVCGADFDTESFLKTHKNLCNGKPRRQQRFICSVCRTKSGNVRFYLNHFATKKHRSRCPSSKQLPTKNKKK